MATSDVLVRNIVRQLRTKAWQWYWTLQPNQRSYFNAAVMVGLYLLFDCFGWELSKGFMGLGVIFWGLAMIADLIGLYKTIFETHLGKLFLLITFGLGTNLAVAIASQIVNELVGVDPGKFVHTIAFVTVFVAPPLLLFLSILVLIVGVAGLALYVMFNFLPDENSRVMMFPWYRPREGVRYRAITALVQVVSAVVLASLGYQWWTGSHSVYESIVKDRARWFLYTFEMFDKAPCALEQGQRVTFLDGSRVLFATKSSEEITFVLGECKDRLDHP